MRLITQTFDEGCLSACLAMILEEAGIDGIDYGTVVSEFHGLYFQGQIAPAAYLRLKGVKVRELNGLQRIDRFGAIYLLCVPSLNKEATFHSVVADCRDVLEIYDPRQDGKHRYYAIDPPKDDPLAVRFKGHIIEAEILLDGGPSE